MKRDTPDSHDKEPGNAEARQEHASPLERCTRANRVFLSSLRPATSGSVGAIVGAIIGESQSSLIRKILECLIKRAFELIVDNNSLRCASSFRCFLLGRVGVRFNNTSVFIEGLAREWANRH